MEKITHAQKLLIDQNIDGWLLYDFRMMNKLACQFLEIPEKILLTRRFFYWIPKEGLPIKIVSTVENPLLHLPGKELKFRSWQQIEEILKEILPEKALIAMEYSPNCAVPEISRVDGGTIDLVRKLGVIVVSSENLLTHSLSEPQWESQQQAAEILDCIAQKTWDWITEKLNLHQVIREYDVQQFMLKCMQEKACVTNHPPICAVNAHSSDPHYAPAEEGSAIIQYGDFLLIDLWCKKNMPGSIYGDITRVGVVGRKPNEKERRIFDIVKEAQAKALNFVIERYQNKQSLFGFEVDQVCRDVIEAAGYGNAFLHRTGHNIAEEDHGPGAHIDNLETHDTRKLLPGTCFSIEPGIYLKGEFGVRLEYDVYLHPEGQVIVTGGIQNSIYSLGEVH